MGKKTANVHRLERTSLLAGTVLALVVALSPAKAGGDDGWGDKPEEKAKAAAAKKAKAAKRNPRVEARLEVFLKKNKRIAQYRRKIADTQAQIHLLEDAETLRERRRAEREIPKLEKKIKSYKGRLDRALKKLRKPYDRELAKVKDEEANYQNKAAALEEKGRNADRYHEKIDALQPDIRRLNDALSILDAAGDVEENELEGAGK